MLPHILFFRHSLFNHLLSRKALLASSYLKRCFSWLCKEAARAAVLPQWCSGWGMSNFKVSHGQRQKMSVFKGGDENMWSHKRAHEHIGPFRLRSLCKVRLQRMRRRRRRRKDLPHMSPPCFVCEPGEERGGYTRDVAPKWQSALQLCNAYLAMAKWFFKNTVGLGMNKGYGVWHSRSSEDLGFRGPWSKMFWIRAVKFHNSCNCKRQRLQTWEKKRKKKGRNIKRKEAKRELEQDSKRAERILRLLANGLRG